MLILERQKDEVVFVYAIEPTGKRLIGKVVVGRIKGNRIKLGMEFLPEYQLLRGELVEKGRAA